MKNIYQDDITGGNVTDSTENKKVVRSAKQAPPPIKRSVIPGKVQPTQEQNPVNLPQQGFYPQAVYYQPDGSQAYPVYFAPVPGQPVITPGYTPPVQSQPTQPAPTDTSQNSAGTRVLFQSADFDKNDTSSEAEESYIYNDSVNFDLAEVSLPSGKRAPAPTAKKSNGFNVEEMEIGTYEFNIMTAGQTAHATHIDTPDNEKEEESLTEENYIDEVVEDEISEEDVEVTEDKKILLGLPAKEVIRRAVLVISLIAIVIACASLLNEYRLHRENKNLLNDLSGMIITEAVTESTTEKTTKPSKKPQDSEKVTTTVPSTLPLVERPLTVEEQWEALKTENPDVVFPAGMQLKYAKLYAQNTDFVGYLRAAGSELDTPVVQGEDDNEYVETNFYGEYTKYACPFVTSINNIENLDTNTVIFGHHMRDGSIFGTLDQYRSLDGYKKAPVISFDTIYKDYDFKVIATMITNIDPKDDNDYVFTYYWTNLNNERNFTTYLNQLSQRSLYDTGVDVLPTDKLLTLSTCCKDFENARLVVVARLVRPGESSEVDTSKAVKNENVRFPQAYYDELGKENPFAGAYQWQIS